MSLSGTVHSGGGSRQCGVCGRIIETGQATVENVNGRLVRLHREPCALAFRQGDFKIQQQEQA